MIREYMTGRKITPEHERRTKVETIVPDSSANQIIDDLVKIRSGSEGRGMIFIKEVVNAYEIGTAQSGEGILSSIK
jgi:nitrogen regulatory protein P-II 1